MSVQHELPILGKRSPCVTLPKSTQDSDQDVGLQEFDWDTIFSSVSTLKSRPSPHDNHSLPALVTEGSTACQHPTQQCAASRDELNPHPNGGARQQRDSDSESLSALPCLGQAHPTSSSPPTHELPEPNLGSQIDAMLASLSSLATLPTVAPPIDLSSTTASGNSGHLPLGLDLNAPYTTAKPADTTGSNQPKEVTSSVSLEIMNAPLWSRFYAITNEMITSSKGRQLFPALHLSVRGLEAEEQYMVWLHFQCEDEANTIWKYAKSVGWQLQAKPSPKKSRQGSERCKEKKNQQAPRHIYNLEASPATGKYLIENGLSFSKLRITNRPENTAAVFLESFHLYTPVVYILPIQGDSNSAVFAHPKDALRFPLKLCRFIASTAYHNDRLVQLKIKCNPMARNPDGNPRRDIFDTMELPQAPHQIRVPRPLAGAAMALGPTASPHKRSYPTPSIEDAARLAPHVTPQLHQISAPANSGQHGTPLQSPIDMGATHTPACLKGTVVVPTANTHHAAHQSNAISPHGYAPCSNRVSVAALPTTMRGPLKSHAAMEMWASPLSHQYQRPGKRLRPYLVQPTPSVGSVQRVCCARRLANRGLSCMCSGGGELGKMMLPPAHVPKQLFSAGQAGAPN